VKWYDDSVLLRTEWVRRFVRRTSPHPNDTHGRAASAELHALANPLALPILAKCYLTKTNKQFNSQPSRLSPPFFSRYEHGG
jgi:hypothetical protein